MSWGKWFFAIFLEDKHKRYNWLIRFCGIDVGRCYKETQEQTVLRLRQAGCTCPQPLIGYHGEKIRCRLCNTEEIQKENNWAEGDWERTIQKTKERLYL